MSDAEPTLLTEWKRIIHEYCRREGIDTLDDISAGTFADLRKKAPAILNDLLNPGETND